MLTTFKYLLRPLAINPNMFCLDKRRKRPSGKLAVTMLYAILLLFAWSFDQFTIFSKKKFSSARYHFSGEVTEASLQKNDSFVALYPFFVFCFNLLDQFATWLGVNIFKYWRTLNYYLEIYSFRRYVLWEMLG